MPRPSVALVALLGVATLVLLVGCSQEDDLSTWPVERKLAAVERNAFVTADDPQVQRYRVWLDQLEQRCTQNRQAIADITLGGRSAALRRGKVISVERLLSDLVLVTAGTGAPVDCIDAVALLALSY